ncbi:protocadherin-1 isoform X1 [Latimeria chalumnae]|uniref:Protocadherin 1 n=1 Tax=Latimeria chalumnae TaxID=7897 RepID=H3B8A4_LATCH|nr:PREDICTED: protocadherin-1 isoform X2 [Latimeria chalumnae]XP_005995412.1 PREDICTED: protocadherin-1 isoform X2 [Latimeria chalumnae]XP_014343544.1 PREDICTED: protocadherin-1 isoform X2 [Latimeria chalumnae]|eukprot:XP_005995411.1 PREDICTED: protocadherin-1 isoform X2 [Latimeria chalumnae]
MMAPSLKALQIWLVVLALCCRTRVLARVFYKFLEEQPPNILIGSLAEDHGYPDTGHLYKLEVGAPYLRVDGKTGKLYTTETSIDREALKECQNLFPGDPCILEFEVSITDLAMNVPRLVEGRIEVLDVNDNSPRFEGPVINLKIPENANVGALFPIPMARDRDAGSNGVASYELQMGHEEQVLFNLQVAEDQEEKQPQLIVMENLDREQKDSYDLSIWVHDGGDPPKTGSAILRITVLDVNDNAPKFEKLLYEGSVAENSPIGHSVLQVKANDLDQGPNAEIDYVFHLASDTVQRLFHLDNKTGVITVNGIVDREEVSVLRFMVIAKDRGVNPKSARATVVINIKDENDNAPTIEIRGIGLVTHEDGVANISEDVAVETPVALVQVSDQDEGENAAVTCVVAGDVPFQLKPTGDTLNDSKKKYFLQTTTPLDYESMKEYTIEIVAVDSGNPPLSSTNSLKVQVVDVNDNAPVFAQNIINVDFAENNEPGDKVYRVEATDADSGENAELVYSLIPDPSTKGMFEISPGSGEIKVNEVLDREERERYEFLVVATDKGSHPLKGTATVVVHVLDQNDNDPKFMLSSYNFSVSENKPPLSPIGMVTVTDADKGKNAQIKLFVESDNDDFMIQNGSGTILSSISFDREQQSTYTFKIKATDGGDLPRSTYVGVSINVLDENDNAPYITHPANSSYHFIAASNNEGEKIEVKAEDIDAGRNAELTYTIVGGNPFQLFQISPSSGVIVLEKEILRRHYGLHRLVVRVKDQGEPSQHATALVHVYVNETLTNKTMVENLVGHSLYTPLDIDIAGDSEFERQKQRSNILFGIIAGIFAVILVIVIVVLVRYCWQRDAKSGYQAGKKETKDLYTPKQNGKNKGKNKKNKVPKPPKPVEDDEESGLQKSLKFNLMNDSVNESPRIHLPLNYPPGSPDLGRHYRSNSPLPSIQLQPQSPTASKKHQAVQDLPATNTFVGTGDNNSTGSDQYSDYSYKGNSTQKYNKQLPHRRVTFSTANQAQDLQDPSQHNYYDSGLEESETPSSKSSSGPRIGPLALPEDNYERTTPDGSIGEMEHPENDLRSLPDVAMTGNCTRECTEYGHSDTCWMPGQPSPNRKPKNTPKLSTFVPYQDQESQDRLTNGSPKLSEDRNAKVANIRSLPTYSAFSSASHEPTKDSIPLEEIPLTQTSDFPQATTPSTQSSKREIYL